MPAWMLLVVVGGCVLDRTGQSATTVMQTELDAHAARLQSLDSALDRADSRVGQLEELTRTRGQEEILKMETMDQLRQEVARLRGDLEVLNHDYGQNLKGSESKASDAQFRLAWLEVRADQLERSLGLKTPAPPAAPAAGAAQASPQAAASIPAAAATVMQPPAAEPAQAPAAIATAAPVVPVNEEPADPEDLLALAEKHLAGGREEAAEAVLERFLDENPKHARVAEARYRLAEAKYNAKDYQAAVLAFQRVIDEHRESAWAPWAMLRQGESFEALGKKKEATLFYEDTVRLWPKSKAAKEAKAKLAK